MAKQPIHTIMVDGVVIEFYHNQRPQYIMLIEDLIFAGYTVEPLDDNNVEAYI